MKTTTHLYLSPKTTIQDVECVNLARLGLGYEAIANRTGLSYSQIGYRLKIAGVSPSQYRKGESNLAKQVIAAAHENSKEYFNTMTSQVLKFLKDHEPAINGKEAEKAA